MGDERSTNAHLAKRLRLNLVCACIYVRCPIPDVPTT